MVRVKCSEKYYEGASAADVVAQFARRDFEEVESVAWMQVVKRRLMRIGGVSITFEYDDADAFLVELERVGLIEILSREW